MFTTRRRRRNPLRTRRRGKMPDMIVRSSDTAVFYAAQGVGAPVVLLHPFPATHEFWLPVAEQLSTQYKLIMPDLRGLGASGPGDGPALMEKHADDVRRICDDVGFGKATFAGISIGGYILFEFWRRHRERVNALVLCDTKAAADNEEGRQGRMKAAELVQERGPEIFIDEQIPRLLGETTQRNRPDIVSKARKIMMVNTAKGIAAVQLGMAARPDSTATLATINVPTLFVGGAEDMLSPPEELNRMGRMVGGSEVKVIPGVGHYSAFEKPDEFVVVLREFLGKLNHQG